MEPEKLVMPKKNLQRKTQKQNPSCPKWLDELENLKEKRDQLAHAFKRATDAEESKKQSFGPQNFSACAALRAEIRPLITELREYFLTKEEQKMVDQLEKDYNTAIQTLKSFNLLDAKNGTAYTSNYAEFAGKQFKVPAWPEIKSRFTVGANRKECRLKLASIMEMQKRGNDPRLYLTPVGKTITSLAEAIDRKNGWSKHHIDADDIRDHELQYFPQEIIVGSATHEVPISTATHKVRIPNANETRSTRGASSAPDFRITYGNSKTKAQVITENKGFLITVAESRQELITDPEVAGEANPDRHGLHGISDWNKLNGYQKLARYLSFQQAHHQTGLTCEDYIVMEMVSFHCGFGALEDFEERYSYLNGVSLIPSANWQRGVMMHKHNFTGTNHRFAIRGAVRI
jgi:hypothetical protein